MAPTMIAGGVLYPPSLLWSLPFVPNLLYANVFTISEGASDALPHIPKASAARVPPGARAYNDLLVVGPGLPDEAMREEVLRAEVVCIEEPGDASRDDIRRSLRLDDVVRK